MANWRVIESTARTAASRGAELVLLSEGFLEGYVIEDVCTNNASFVALSPSAQKAAIARFKAIAEPLDGPYIAKAKALSRELGIYLQFGFLQVESCPDPAWLHLDCLRANLELHAV